MPSLLRHGMLSTVGAISLYVLKSQIESSFEIDENLSNTLKNIIIQCPSIIGRKYRPTFYLSTGLLQNIFSAKDSQVDENIFYNKEEIDFGDDGSLFIRPYLSINFRLCKVSNSH